MGNQPLLAYFIARRNAAEMDRRGVRPNLLIRVVVGFCTIAGFGMICVAALVGALFIAGMFGII